MTDDAQLTEAEKATVTEIAAQMFVKLVTPHFECSSRDDLVNSLLNIRNGPFVREVAEHCFLFGIQFAWAQHRILDNCPDYQGHKND